MRFYGRSPEQAVQETIRDYRQAAGYIKPLRDTLDRFGGKVYNKRFLDALRAAAGYDRIYDDRRAEMVYIYIYTANNYDPHTICRISQSACNAKTRYSVKPRYTVFFIIPRLLRVCENRVKIPLSA